ncbi:phage tail protein, partial [Escherichia coli]|nr:phage tail protein [Escherichia coli]
DLFLWRGRVVQTGNGYHATSEFHRLHRIDWWRWLQRRLPTAGRHFRTGSTSRQWKAQRDYRSFVEAYSRRINEFRLDQHIRRYI